MLGATPSGTDGIVHLGANPGDYMIPRGNRNGVLDLYDGSHAVGRNLLPTHPRSSAQARLLTAPDPHQLYYWVYNAMSANLGGHSMGYPH